MVSYLNRFGGLWGMADWLVGAILGLLGRLFDWMNGGVVWVVQKVVTWFANGLDYYGWLWHGDALYWVSDTVGWFALHNIWPSIHDGGPVQGLLTAVVVVLVFFIWSFLHLLLMMWMELKVVARFWDMRGPIHMGGGGFLVTMAYAMKLMVKEIITPKKADKWLYTVAPALFTSSSMLLFAGVPLSPDFYVSDLALGIVFLMAVFGIAPLAVIGGGWASNNKYTLIGGMRSAAMLMSYEIPMLLSLVPVFLVVGSFNPLEIAAAQEGNIAYIVPFFLGFLVLLICVVAETERIPFDLPEAEAELVEGWTTEYGGMRFGFIMFSEYIRSFVGAGIVAILFLGGWNTPILNNLFGLFGYQNPLPAMLVMLGKIYLTFFVFIWLRASLPRVRTDQILNFGWKRLLPLALVNILIAVGLKSWGVL